MRFYTIRSLVFLLLCVCVQKTAATVSDSSSNQRQKHLDRLLSFFEINDGVPGNPHAIRVSPLDSSWMAWLHRTGELPPDFDSMPGYPTMPDPLVINDDGQSIPVRTVQQWLDQRERMKDQIQYWITGTCPPAPDNLEAMVLNETITNGVTRQQIELSFGPQHKARLSVELYIPPGNGPFPVFLTQSNHLSWAKLAVRRGYIACLYAGNDRNDDADAWAELYYPDYDFSLLMRRAWAAHRTIDYLYTLPIVDKSKIGITGHSRNGKQALMAAAFDERITACIPSSAGTGGEIPYRYAREKYTVETLKVLTGRTTSWFHPRLRFFVGNEYKLPVDQNFLMALVAPRHLMLSSAFTEPYGNPWGIEQMYHSVAKVYEFMNAGDHLALSLRLGGHGTLPYIIEEYLDFFDYAFGLNNMKPRTDSFWHFSFKEWLTLSGENIDPRDFPEKDLDDLLVKANDSKISSVKEWENKKKTLYKSIQWSLGNAPKGVDERSPQSLSQYHDRQDYMDDIVGRPGATESMGRKVIKGLGDLQHGFLYYPKHQKTSKLPVLIWLHEYSYSSGFQPTWPYTSAFSIEKLVNQGFAVFTFDFIGMGTRIKEGKRFYQRYPTWSKMGKMVHDVQDAITLLQNLDEIDPQKIVVAGYALGGTIGLYAAALDSRIHATAAFGAFTPLRRATHEKGLLGLKEYSYLHGLQPRLGFFVGCEKRLPYDFHEILASIAPRPLLLVSPKYDQDICFADVNECVSLVGQVFELYEKTEKLTFLAPEYYNQFIPERFQELCHWLNSLDLVSATP